MRKSTKNKSLVSIVLSLILILAVTFSITAKVKDNSTQKVNIASTDSGKLIVNFIDVGQGDCEFIQLPDDKCILIDAGTNLSKSIIEKYLNSKGCKRIDYLIATHPHADHIGAMADIINDYDIGDIYMPKVSANTKIYENLLQAIADKNLKINSAKAGVSVCSNSMYNAYFLAPVESSYSGLNNYSAVLKLEYGSDSFLFTGDSEELSEEQMLENNYDALKSDVLKVGHHGSDSSSSVDFLDAVSPKYAVISCGINNSYGHPSSQTLKRLQNLNSKVYRTDKNHNIVIESNGNNSYNITTGD